MATARTRQSVKIEIFVAARDKRDEVLSGQIERIGQVNFKVYGADKVWHRIKRESAPDGCR